MCWRRDKGAAGKEDEIGPESVGILVCLSQAMTCTACHRWTNDDLAGGLCPACEVAFWEALWQKFLKLKADFETWKKGQNERLRGP